MLDKGEKIQKFLASAGCGSRRHCETLVDEMRVMINGDLAERGSRVKPGDDIRLDGSRIRKAKTIFYKLYKPKGYLCTDSTQHKILRAQDLLPPKLKQRLFAVGRLDKDFEGLIIFTNDGHLCHRLTHPTYKIKKIYEVRIKSFVKQKDLEKISNGVWLHEGKTSKMEIRLKRRNSKSTSLTLNLTENRRRLIPRVFAKLGYHVERVKRIGVGPIRLKGLEEGQACRLSPEEIKALQKIIDKR